MSPVSRGRKPKKSKKRISHRSGSPARRGFDFEPLIDDLLPEVEKFADDVDPVLAELAGAHLCAYLNLSQQLRDQAVRSFVPLVEKRGTPAALGLLEAAASVTAGKLEWAMRQAAGRLAASGVPRLGWAEELAQPVTAGDMVRMTEGSGVGSVLRCSFHRGGRTHEFVVTVDHLHCGAASQVALLDDATLAEHAGHLDKLGQEVEVTTLEPSQLRWYAECTLDARAAHDVQDEALGLSAIWAAAADDKQDRFPAVAALLRARLAALPAPSWAKPAHGQDEATVAAMSAVDAAPGAGAAVRDLEPLPPAGDAEAGAPVYQVKISLRGGSPPIWRRLEVPADMTLARLHDIIQFAFEWDYSHLHVFETPYGEFASNMFGEDAQYGRRPADSVTLGQAAPRVKSKFSYTYDFGDYWVHDIVVEKVLDRDESVAYPRCTSGRRAAPPEDCGGIYGYQHMVEALGDPSHPDHEHFLEWMDLDEPGDFDPASFSTTQVNARLSRLR